VEGKEGSGCCVDGVWVGDIECGDRKSEVMSGGQQHVWAEGVGRSVNVGDD
jgi:hypothetical protein